MEPKKNSDKRDPYIDFLARLTVTIVVICVVIIFVAITALISYGVWSVLTGV